VGGENKIATVTITFPPTAADGATNKTTVNALTLDKLIPAPVKGETATDKLAVEPTQYTGSVKWQTSNGTSFTGDFEAAIAYKAVVTLTAKDGYTFIGLAEKAFSYTGATTVRNDSGTVTITFPSTAEAEGAIAISIGFEQGITITPSGSFTISKTGASYSQSVTLSAASGYISVEWYVDGNPVTPATGSGCITINATDSSLIPGQHYVTFTGKIGGNWYSKEIPFTVVVN
jgi:hypothetical protein